MAVTITQAVDLSFTENLVPPIVHVKQYDNQARKIRCTFYDGAVEYTIPDGAILSCSGTRPDGNMFQYWRELEYNYEWRRQALAWIDTLPEGRDGTQAFLNGLTDVYVKAFILDITIYSPLKYSIRWFDNTRTEVVMHSNVEDYRNSASYWDGSKMRENPRGKYGNLKYGEGRLYG